MKKTYKIIICIAILVYGTVWVYFSLPEKGLGKYVYVDDQRILHSTNECKGITRIHGASPVNVYSKDELNASMWNSVCSECVSDKIYRQVMECLQEKASKDSLLNADWSKHGNENRKWLYVKMNENGVNTGSYEDFNNSLDNIAEDRDWYYQKCLRIGLNVGSRENFDSLMKLK